MKGLIAVVAVVVVWFLGLLVFAVQIQHARPPSPMPDADGVVALTGASNARLAEAVDLLAQGRARQMLVSGVNPTVTREQLRRALGVPHPIYDCCVQLGYQAEDTIGNAREIADWARRNDFHSLIVVTSDYHMPRSLMEIRGALPHVKLIPYPVVTPSLDARRWWRSANGARRMTVEYCKFLIVAAREFILWIGNSVDGKHGSRPHAPASPSGAPGAA
jgi:uncharacterized SAM-binding protein YcdF (DUF218 family)